MILKKNDLTLRPLTLKDVKNYLECHMDKDAKKNFSSFPKSLQEAKKELKQNPKMPRKAFAIIHKKQFCGFIDLELNNNPIYKHSAIIGYGIHKDFRNKGLATKAVKLITKYGFEKLKLKRIYGMCRSFNKASARVLQKAGYKHEGTLRKNKFLNGKYLDDLIWAKLR